MKWIEYMSHKIITNDLLSLSVEAMISKTEEFANLILEKEAQEWLVA